MKIELVTDGKRAEIKVSVESVGFYGNYSAEETFLIPEARRLRDQLDQLIKKGENINNPKKAFWK